MTDKTHAITTQDTKANTQTHTHYKTLAQHTLVVKSQITLTISRR